MPKIRRRETRREWAFSFYAKTAADSPKLKLVHSRDRLLKQLRRLAGAVGGLQAHHRPVNRDLRKQLKIARDDYRMSGEAQKQLSRVELRFRGTRKEAHARVKAVIDKLKKGAPVAGLQEISSARELKIDPKAETIGYSVGCDENGTVESKENGTVESKESELSQKILAQKRHAVERAKKLAKKRKERARKLAKKRKERAKKLAKKRHRK